MAYLSSSLVFKLSKTRGPNLDYHCKGKGGETSRTYLLQISPGYNRLPQFEIFHISIIDQHHFGLFLSRSVPHTPNQFRGTHFYIFTRKLFPSLSATLARFLNLVLHDQQRVVSNGPDAGIWKQEVKGGRFTWCTMLTSTGFAVVERNGCEQSKERLNCRKPDIIWQFWKVWWLHPPAGPMTGLPFLPL